MPLSPPDHAPRTSAPATAWSARPAPPDLRERLLGVVAAGRASSGSAAVLLLPTLVLTAVLAAGMAGPPPATGAADPAAASVASYPVGGASLAVAAAPAASVQAEAPGTPVRFASFEDLELFLPSSRAMIAGFHEASYAYALRMRPWGTPLASDNPRKEASPPVGDGPNYAILSSRGRPTQATSAVDVAVPRHAPIASPVSGTVVSVRPYELYGRYADTRIEVRPAGRPDLVVTVLHVSDPQVREGDEVVGGLTRIAGRATAFPFRSHVDAYAGGRPPHVHIELKRA